jgi:hypothetical protein
MDLGASSSDLKSNSGNTRSSFPHSPDLASLSRAGLTNAVLLANLMMPPNDRHEVSITSMPGMLYSTVCHAMLPSASSTGGLNQCSDGSNINITPVDGGCQFALVELAFFAAHSCSGNEHNSNSNTQAGTTAAVRLAFVRPGPTAMHVI